MGTRDPEIQQLFQQGVTAIKSGKLPKAERLLLRLTGMEPGHAASHNLLAGICLWQSRLDEAEHYVGLALLHGGGAPEYQDTVIEILVKRGRGEQALAEFRKAAESNTDDFGTAYGLGSLLARFEQDEESLVWLRRAQLVTDNFPSLRLKIIGLLAKLNNYQEAVEAIETALAMGDRLDDLHTLAGYSYYYLGKPGKAIESFQRGIRQNGEKRENYVGLSVVLARASRMEKATEVTMNFIKRYPSWTTRGRAPEARVLVLGGVGPGYFGQLTAGENIYMRGNTISQIKPDRFTFHYLLVDHPDPALVARSLGPVDVIFNNVANAEIAKGRGYTKKIRQIVDALGVPVINSPEAMARASRAENAIIIPRETDIVFPKTMPYRVTGDGIAASHAEIMKAFSFPFIMRPTSSHHDTDIFLVASEADLATALKKYSETGESEVYVIEYRTEEFLPGVFRKIRCALIDGEVYLVHVDFSPNWNVHRTRVDKVEIEFMKANQHLMDQEHAFLRDPEGSLGAENMRRLRDLARVMDLDFVGVDFNILSNGDLVIFEANAAMNTIVPHKVKHFPYFAAYWERIQVAFENMILRKAGKA